MSGFIFGCDGSFSINEVPRPVTLVEWLGKFERSRVRLEISARGFARGSAVLNIVVWVRPRRPVPDGVPTDKSGLARVAACRVFSPREYADPECVVAFVRTMTRQVDATAAALA